MNDLKLSQIISHALRHDPGSYGLIIKKNGWTNLEQLALGIREKYSEFNNITVEDIERVVNSFTKKRHEIKGAKIRALFGHSIRIEERNIVAIPPKNLFHGTSYSNFLLIKSEGLKRVQRQFVHLWDNKLDAEIVASRKPKPTVILRIEAKRASDEGIAFYQKGDVWLAKEIPPKYIQLV